MKTSKDHNTKSSSVPPELPNKSDIIDSPVHLQTPGKPIRLSDALLITQENMIRLQEIQEQTTLVYRQFLENQATIQHTFQSLVDQQQGLFQTSFGMSMPSHVKALRPPIPKPVQPSIQAQSNMTSSFEPDIISEHPEADFTTESAPPALEVVSPDQGQDLSISSEEHPKQTEAPLPCLDIESNIIEKILLEVVAEKTGYPVEMLELSMELDSDLGIDSIKRVEILSDLQEKLPEAPIVKPEHLSTLKTLGQIADFLAESSGIAQKTTSTPSDDARTDKPQNSKKSQNNYDSPKSQALS